MLEKEVYESNNKQYLIDMKFSIYVRNIKNM